MLNSVSIIIPAYNEERRIENTLLSYCKNYKDVEIIVVSNGSVDNTNNIVKKLQIKYSQIKLLEFPKKLGKGGAIIEGFKIAKNNIIGFIDADDAFDIAGTKKLIEIIDNEGYDCASASKWRGKKFFEVNEPFLRKVLSRFWKVFVDILLNLNMEDTQAGAKFLKKFVFESMNKIFISKSFAFDVELIYKIKKRGFKIKEIFIQSKPSEYSSFSIKYIPRMIKEIIFLKLNYNK